MKINLIFITLIAFNLSFANQSSEEIQKTIEEANTTISNLNLEIEKLKYNIDSKENLIKTNELEISKIKNEIKVIQLEILKHTSEINEYEIELEIKREEISTIEIERDAIKQNIEVTLDKIEINKKQIEKNIIDLNSIIKELDERMIYLFKNGKKDILLNILNNDFNSNNTQVYKYISILLDNDIELSNKIDSKITILNNNQNELENEYINLNNSNIELKLIIDKLTNEQKVLNGKIKELDSIKDQSSDEFVSLEKKIEDKTTKVNELIIEIDNLKLESQDKTSQINQFERKLKILVSDKKAAREREKKINQNSTQQSLLNMKGKLNWPIDGIVISKYGIQTNKILNTRINNIGIKIGAKENTKVKSIYDGVVAKIDYMPSYGNFIVIDHSENIYTIYSNVKNIIIKKDQYINSNDVIAQVAKSEETINGENTYLSFQIFHNGKNDNPESWLLTK